jgi:hypothetical protein
MKLKQKELNIFDISEEFAEFSGECCHGVHGEGCRVIPESSPEKEKNGFPMSKTVREIIRELTESKWEGATEGKEEKEEGNDEDQGEGGRTCLGHLTGFLELATDTPRLFARMTTEQLRERYERGMDREKEERCTW